MRQDRRFQRKKGGEERRRLIQMAAIPLLVVILMIIIVIADHIKAGSGETEPEVTAEQMETPGEICVDDPNGIVDGNGTESGGETAAEPQEPLGAFETEDFRKDSIPEILELMKAYFDAREASDAAAMNQLYGGGELTEAQLEENRMKLRSNAKYVLGFENISTYVREANVPDTWLVYTLYDIRFHSVETAAPMIMWSFVKMDGEGVYRLVEQSELSEELLEFADKVNHSEEVRRLASDVNVRLKEALTADEALNEVYGVLRDGSPVYGEEETEPAVVVVEEETEETRETKESESEQETPEETTAAETGAPAPSAAPSSTIEAFETESKDAGNPAVGPEGAVEAGAQGAETDPVSPAGPDAGGQ